MVVVALSERGLAASDDPRPVPAPTLAWQACPAPEQKGFLCATARVPLDHRQPSGASIELAVIKHPAQAGARRIGTLFFNPGGPGGAGTDDLPAWLSRFPAELRARFDLVSWDPRGIGRSTAVQCFRSAEEEQRFLAQAPVGFPVGRRETAAWIDVYDRFAARCARRVGELLRHVSTADTARDLDLLRRAVGEPALNYLGVSYGTYLGATYANLFPDKVRAMVLDGNIDPIAWTNDGKNEARLGFALRYDNDLAAAKKVVDAFLTLCGASANADCAFSAGSPAATRAKLEALLQRLRQRPVTIGDERITYAALVEGLDDLFFVTQRFAAFPGWATAAARLQTIWQGSGGDEARAPAADADAPAEAAAPPATDASYAGLEQGLAVECGESPMPRDPELYVGIARRAFARSGPYGSYWAWNDEQCARWRVTAPGRYTGPWDRATAAPILVIGNTYDRSCPGAWCRSARP
jgi:pimeloyl-ACP methyl ester carboxylesterase